MTIRELYELAVARGAEDYTLVEIEYGEIEAHELDFDAEEQKVYF